MAILSKISVGDILYYSVDDIPTHVAPKGSVSILTNDDYVNKVIWVNNDGGSVWLKSISQSFGSLRLDNGTTGVAVIGTQALGSWYSFNDNDTWTFDTNSVDFSQLLNSRLRYDGTKLSRFYTRVNSTLIAGPSKWVSWVVGPSLNLTVPLSFQAGFGLDNSGRTNINASLINELKTNDVLIASISPTSVEGGGNNADRTYIPRYAQLSSYKLDEALQKIVFVEDWESNSFTTNTWSVVNDSVNVWVIGTAENNTVSGTYSAYISNNSGTSASYTNTISSISHFYKDFTFDEVDNISLSFDWKCQGENGGGATEWDYGTIVIADTSITPVGGTEVITTQAAIGGNGRIGATTNLGKFNLKYGTTPGNTWNTETIDLSAYAGQTKRLVFTWVNDGSVGTNPPFIIDNIKITENIW